MSHIKLVVGTRGADGRVPLTLTNPTGADTSGVLELADFAAPWTVEAIHEKLNDKGNRQHAEQLGKGLYDRLFATGSAIRKAWETVANQPYPLELQIDDAELRGYPWELLWDDADRKHARVRGLVRRSDVIFAPPASSEWPFRLLIIIGVNDELLAPVDRIGAMQEVDLLRRTLVDFGRTIDIHVLSLPARAYVQKTLQDYQPHVLHFIGHGTFDQGKQRHSLVIEEVQSTWNWNTSENREDLTVANCIPRLVCLNCCRSASERESNLSLQKALSDHGVPVVVAMQADVRGDKAAEFGKAFYGHALVGTNRAQPLPGIVEAIREGRRKLGTEADVDWALPTLTFCKDVPMDYALLTRRQWPNDANFRRCREFDEARVYADSSEARRKMIQWFYPVRPGPEPNVIILRGPAASGKTRLLHWCMESWAAVNLRLRYLRVDQPRGKNCLKWLIRLRAGEVSQENPDDDRFLKEGLELAPFTSFYEAVAKAAKLSHGPNIVADAKKRVELIDTFQCEVTDDVAIGPLCDSFLQGLHQLGSIVLVFDQLSDKAIEPVLFSGFRDAFLVPLAEPGQANVRVVLALTREDYDKFGLAGLDDRAARVVDLKADQTPAQLEQLAVEALRYRQEQQLRAIAMNLLKFQETRRTGLGRLDFCQPLLDRPEFQDLERMK